MAIEVIPIRKPDKLKAGLIYYGQVIYIDRDMKIDDFGKWTVWKKTLLYGEIQIEIYDDENNAIDCCFILRENEQKNIYRIHARREYFYSTKTKRWA